MKQEKIIPQSLKIPKPDPSFYWTVGIITAVAIFFIVMFRHFKKHAVLLNARTTEWASGAKMLKSLKYEFYSEGKLVTGSNAFPMFYRNPNFENRYFPVMYDKWSGQTQLLIRPVDFKEWDIPFPDSLNWVLEYMDK